MAKRKIFETQKSTLKLFILFIIHCSLLIANCLSQSITWQRTYGRPLPYEENAYSVIQTPDEGYIVVGTNYFEALSLRLNKFGDTLWTRFLTGGRCYKIIRTHDNNYVVLKAYDRISKIDINGDILWSAGPYNPAVIMIDIQQLSDGGFLMCGLRDFGLVRKPHIIRIDSVGGFMWERTYTSNIFDGQLNSFIILPTNELIFAGHYSDADTITDELFIMKTDLQGNPLFFYGYDTLRYHFPIFIHNSSNNTFTVGGTNGTFLIRISSSGVIQWYKRYLAGITNDCRGLVNSIDWGYALTGWRDSIGNVFHYMFLLKTDSSGNEQWRKTYGVNDDYSGNDIKQTLDSGYIIAGYKGEDIYVVKTDKTGFVNPIGIKPISNVVPMVFNLYQNYPNPFNPSTKIRFDVPFSSNVKLSIINVLGEEITIVVNEKLATGTFEIEYNAKNISSGIYFYRIITEKYTATKKMIVLK